MMILVSILIFVLVSMMMMTFLSVVVSSIKKSDASLLVQMETGLYLVEDVSKALAHIHIAEWDGEGLEHLADAEQQKNDINGSGAPVEEDTELKKGKVNTTSHEFWSQTLSEQKRGFDLEHKRNLSCIIYLDYQLC